MNCKFRFVLLSSLMGIIYLGMVEPSWAVETAFIYKAGSATLVDHTQEVNGTTRDFDDWSDETYAMNIEWRSRKQTLGLGFEYLHYEHEFVLPQKNGYSMTQALLFSARQYFTPIRVFHPFIGAGLGLRHAKIDDWAGNVDRQVHLAYQAMAGIEFRLCNAVGIFTEVKGLYTYTSDNSGDFDPSSVSFLSGISFIF